MLRAKDRVGGNYHKFCPKCYKYGLVFQKKPLRFFATLNRFFETLKKPIEKNLSADAFIFTLFQ